TAVLLCVLTLTAAAVPNGTVVNHTMYTDIVALIDNHPIRAYNVDNRMVVVAEDLRGYGFYAIWHAEERWLEVTRPVENGEPAVPAFYPDYTPEAPAGKIGTPAHDILATDIVTTIAGDAVESWNINGETCILFRDLECYGDVLYDNETRTAMFVTMPYKVLAGGHAVEQEAPKPWDVKASQTESSMTAVFTAGTEASVSTFLSVDKTDVNMDLIWGVDTDPVSKVTLAFYPGLFPAGGSLRHSLYDTLSALPIPSMTENVNGTNTPEVRMDVAQVFWVTLNGRAVNGDLFRSQGNGHVDFTFLFDKGFEIKPGDSLTVTVLTPDNEVVLCPQTGSVPEDASPEELLASLRKRILYHEAETIENDLCYVIRGYFSGTSSGNQNDLYVVYKNGGMKDLTGSAYPYFQTVDKMEFGKDPNTLIVTGKVLTADKTDLTASALEIDIHTGTAVVK
ncbi:MAG: hypothetical protein J6V24_11455, partial [Clostridia bacterium]|nr:hypothetical protein [Clostridia bacterium]